MTKQTNPLLPCAVRARVPLLARQMLLATSVLAMVSSGCQEGEPEDTAQAGQELAGDFNSHKLALDAPWRMEPSPTGTYGAIPIQLTLRDNALAGGASQTFKYIEIIETLGANTVRTRFLPSQLHELESSEGTWNYSSGERHDSTPCRPNPLPSVSPSAPNVWGSSCPTAPPTGRICRGWVVDGSTCADLTLAQVGHTNSWHGTIMYPLKLTASPGRYVELRTEATFVAYRPEWPFFSFDVVETDELLVHLASAPLPKFGPGWAYGDLHYHSQLTNNFGEQGYSFRGTLSAMSAMGMDFAFATDHTSNNRRVFGWNANPASPIQMGGLGDASPTKWAYGHWLLNHKGGGVGYRGANHEVLSVARRRQYGLAAPQLFLGGEVDVIPETENRSTIGFGGTKQSINNLCQPDTLGCDDFHLLNPLSIGFDPSDLAQPIPGEPGHYFVHDPQGIPITTKFYGRQHLIHLPRDASRDDSGIMADTSVFGGATRRLRDVLRDEFETKQKGYAFLAHPFHSPGSDDPGFFDEQSRRGPDIIGFSESQLVDAFRSEYILGVQFWNENDRFESGGSGEPFTGGSVAEPWYEGRPDYGKWRSGMARYGSSWDELLMWGVDPDKTVDVEWLEDNEPRRFFMAGGSDAHGDFNYRRKGRLSGTDGMNDTAIGNPRNLVFTGTPAGTLTQHGRTASRLTQEQVVDGLRSGNFSVTDGPAVRIVYDRNRNGVIDASDPGMGSVTGAEFDGPIPVIVEWKSTEEFGQVRNVSLVIGVHGDGVGTKYRGTRPGVAQEYALPFVRDEERQFRPWASDALGVYWNDWNQPDFLQFRPTLAPASADSTGDAYGGTYRFWISPQELPLIVDGQSTPAGLPERMWIRTELVNDWVPNSGVRAAPRFAYSNPLWLTKAPPPGPLLADVAIDPTPVPTDDIVWQTSAGQMLYWRMQGGKRMLRRDVSSPVHPAWTPRDVGDLNGDGTDDIVFRQSNGQVHYWPVRDGKRLAGINIATPVSSSWVIRGVGDVNGDGTGDIIWQHTNGQVYCWLLENGVYVRGNRIHSPVSADWSLKGVGDINGDGTDDIVWQHSSGQLHYWPMRDGQRLNGYNISAPVGSNWLVRGVGDVTGDGTDDIVFQRSTGEVHYWRMHNGSRAAGVDVVAPVGSTWTLVGVGDLD